MKTNKNVEKFNAWAEAHNEIVEAAAEGAQEPPKGVKKRSHKGRETFLTYQNIEQLVKAEAQGRKARKAEARKKGKKKEQKEQKGKK